MESDTLHWSAALACWVVTTGRGTLWVPKESFLREIGTVLDANYHVTSDSATNVQFLEVTKTVQTPSYWDTVDDPEVTRFPAGEAPHDQ